MSNLLPGSVPRPQAPPTGAPKAPGLQPLHLNADALEAIAHARDSGIAMRVALEQLLELARQAAEPPETRPIILTPTQPVVTDKSQWEAKSIGLLNTCPVVIYIGLGGASATLAGRGLPVPANSMIVWPCRDYDVEIGADPGTPIVSNAVLQLIRFSSVQRAFLGRGV